MLRPAPATVARAYARAVAALVAGVCVAAVAPAQETVAAADPAEETFFEEQDETPVDVPAPAQEVFRNTLLVEYRQTDVFEEPAQPELFAPAENLVYAAYGYMISWTDFVKIEGERLSFGRDDDAAPAAPYEPQPPQDYGWVSAMWDHTLASGSRVYVDAGGTGSAWWTTLEYGTRWRHNLDISGHVRQTTFDSGEVGGRFGGEAKAVLGEKTSAQYKGYYYWYEVDGCGYRGSRNQVEIARYLGHRTGLHLQARRNILSSDDYPDIRSASVTLECRHRARGSDTLLRVAYRWYAGDTWYVDGDYVSADGVSLGVEQPFRRGSVGVRYRFYSTSESAESSTWSILAKYLF